MSWKAGKKGGQQGSAQLAKLDAELLSFLRRAEKMLTDVGGADAVADGDGEQEDVAAAQRREIADNIIAQVAGSELHCARHVFGCTVLQSALKAGSDAECAALAAGLFSGANIVALLTDKYGSHVAEAALSRVGRPGGGGEEADGGVVQLLPSVVDRLLEK
eukprot:3577711-Prymnesium_polylepis.1